MVSPSGDDGGAPRGGGRAAQRVDAVVRGQAVGEQAVGGLVGGVVLVPPQLLDHAVRGLHELLAGHAGGRRALAEILRQKEVGVGRIGKIQRGVVVRDRERENPTGHGVGEQGEVGGAGGKGGGVKGDWGGVRVV